MIYNFTRYPRQANDFFHNHFYAVLKEVITKRKKEWALLEQLHQLDQLPGHLE